MIDFGDSYSCVKLIADAVESGSKVVLGTSGGKDSTATGLLLKEHGIPFEPVFCDTGWEHPETYKYLREYLPTIFGPIHWITGGHTWPTHVRLRSLWAPYRAENETKKDWRKRMKQTGQSAAWIKETEETILTQETEEAQKLAVMLEAYAVEIETILGIPNSEMVRRVLTKTIFPRRTARWCTQELKFEPIKNYLATLDAPINVIGIRWEESKERRNALPWEFDDELDAHIARPLVSFKLDDVIAMHAKHGVMPNPLYLKTAARVGCDPCIFSRKEEIAVLRPNVIEAMSLLEKRVDELTLRRRDRNGVEPEQLSPTFFQSEDPHEDGSYYWPIEKVYEWSRTTRGGRQSRFLILPSSRDVGCMRWGLCDTGDAAKVHRNFRQGGANG